MSCKLDGLAVSRLNYIEFVKVTFLLQTLRPFQVTKRRDMPGVTQMFIGRAGTVASHRAVGIHPSQVQHAAWLCMSLTADVL